LICIVLIVGTLFVMKAGVFIVLGVGGRYVSEIIYVYKVIILY
jgi:hypothetical protein